MSSAVGNVLTAAQQVDLTHRLRDSFQVGARLGGKDISIRWARASFTSAIKRQPLPKWPVTGLGQHRQRPHPLVNNSRMGARQCATTSNSGN
jgi:hypothetical protein